MPQILSFRDSLTKGIRSDERSRFGPGDNTTYRNLIPTAFGARPFESIAELIPAAELTAKSITVTPPFPQAFRAGEFIKIFNPEAIYDMPDESTGLINVHLIHDFTTDLSTGLSGPGDPWHFMDFGTSWFAVNSINLLFQTQWKTASRVYVDKNQKFTTGCVWKRRVITAGLNTIDYWNSDWVAYFDALYPQGSASWRTGLQQPKQNFVSIGPIGRSGIPELLDPDIIFDDGNIPTITGGHSATRPLALDLLARGDQSFIPMPWPDPILRVYPITSGIVVFGEQRISGLVPTVLGDVPTFGLIDQVLPIGLASRNAVGGSENESLFLDNEGTLWMMDGAFAATQLGYKDTLSNFLSEEISISYDLYRDVYYISGNFGTFGSPDYRSFRWHRTDGLSECPVVVTSGWNSQGSFQGIAVNSANPTDAAITLPSFRHEGGIRGIQIIGIDTGAVGSRLTIEVEFKNDITSSFNSSTPVEIDPNGYANINGQGTEMRLVLSHPDFTKLEIDDIMIHGTEGKTSIKEAFNA